MPRKSRLKRKALDIIVAEADNEALSYGEYVAREERHAYISARKPNKPSAWVHASRTLIEGLAAEGVEDERK